MNVVSPFLIEVLVYTQSQRCLTVSCIINVSLVYASLIIMSSWGGGNWGGGGDWGAGGDWGPGRALGGSSSGQQNLKKRPAAAADDNDEVHASKRRKTNAGAAAASSSAASGAPKAKAKASPKASPKAKAASAAGAKRTTVSASEITNHFKSNAVDDETFAPHGLSLRNQAQTILSISTALGNQRGGGAAAGSSSAPHQPADTALSHLQIRHIANALSLFREGKDIPFIARYRKALTNDMSEDALRLLKKSLHKLDELEKKRASIILLLQKKKHTHTISKKTFDNVERALSMEELEALYEPYKETIPSKSSLARALGLEYLAEAILRGEDEERLLTRCRAVVGEIKAGRVKGSEEVAVAKKDLPTTADQVLELAMRTGFRPNKSGDPHVREARLRDVEEACNALVRLTKPDLDAAVEQFAQAKQYALHVSAMLDIAHSTEHKVPS